MKVHQIKIDFHVTDQISRFVYVYIIEANSPSREILEQCFASDEYGRIMHERIDSVDARALIVEA